MTIEEQRQGLVDLGFTERQAGFLVQVLRHAGVCVPRQYCVCGGIARGRRAHEFFERLVQHRDATAHVGRDGRSRVYHLTNKRLYRAIGTPDSRLRRAHGLDRTVERLALLDHLLVHPSLLWLATEREKVDHIQQTTPLRLAELPHVTSTGTPGSITRYFPDRLPIGVSPDGRRLVLVYVAWQSVPVDFRGFLFRHAEVLRALPEWDVEVVALTTGDAVRHAYEDAFRDEVAEPLSLSTIDELAWYFDQLRRTPPRDRARWREARRRFGSARFRVLYRAWQTGGDPVLHATSSRVLSEAVSRGRGRFRYFETGHRYRHLTPLLDRTRAPDGGYRGGTPTEARCSPLRRPA